MEPGSVVIPIEEITLAKCERLRPPTDDDHFWYWHYALAWYSTVDREIIAVIYKSSSLVSYLAFTRADDSLLSPARPPELE